jgi:DNA invertase Pin-like site-specific DNA recombinase
VTRLVGYTRELVPGTGTAADFEQLTVAGADHVFADDASRNAQTRSGLHECLESLEAGDTLLVTSAVMLAPTVAQFLTVVSGLANRGVGFRSLIEPALSSGVMVDPAEMFAALEALKRRLSSLQTRAGMASAAREGRRPGRPTVMTPERIEMAAELRNLGRPVTHIARVLGVSANAVQRALTANGHSAVRSN